MKLPKELNHIIKHNILKHKLLIAAIEVLIYSAFIVILTSQVEVSHSLSNYFRMYSNRKQINIIKNRHFVQIKAELGSRETMMKIQVQWLICSLKKNVVKVAILRCSKFYNHQSLYIKIFIKILLRATLMSVKSWKMLQGYALSKKIHQNIQF